jgi:hypothetical protein
MDSGFMVCDIIRYGIMDSGVMGCGMYSGVMVCDMGYGIMDSSVMGCGMDSGVIVCDIMGYGIMDSGVMDSGIMGYGIMDSGVMGSHGFRRYGL